MSESHNVVNNRAASRFETEIEGELAVLNYVETASTIDLQRTDVPATLEGHGVGGSLALTALEYARQSGKRVIPTCPFVRAYIKRHPEWNTIVDAVP
jgi:hypothetical protein